MSTTPLVPKQLADWIAQLQSLGASFEPLNNNSILTDATSASLVYNASHIKQAEERGRRTKAEMGIIDNAICEVVEALRPVTVRQVYYQLVSKGLIRKTESEYNNTVGKRMTNMRRMGRLPYSWVSDNTRWIRKPKTYSSMEHALLTTAQTYRRSLWETQDVYVEIWCEKDALAGVLLEETEPYDVPLMVARGYSSDTFLHSTAEAIQERGKPTYLYYFGDHDPSGVDAERVLREKLRAFAPGTEIHFERSAVTPEQIERWQLPTRNTKTTDSRSRNFVGDSCDVDALRPDVLRTLVRECIKRHINQETLAVVQRIEDAERETLSGFLEAWHKRGETTREQASYTTRC